MTVDFSSADGPNSLSTKGGSDGSTACVSLVGVTKSYEPGSPPAVCALDLSIRAGEFFSLLGPSGSGKTTTLRIIAGFEAPDAGVVRLDGADVSRMPPYRRDISTVFQSYALFPHMTTEKNIAYPLRMHKVPKPEIKRRVGEALELVSMTGFDGRLPHQLSGGQRQRIALARALVSRPKVVLLDEPLGALDLQLRQSMQIMLKQLQREVDVTFIYVTHDQGEALAMSDRLAVMDHGRILQLGAPEDVYYRPANRFVAGFIGKSNLVPATIQMSGGRAVASCGEFALRVPDTALPGAATLAIRYEALRARPAQDGLDPSPGEHLGSVRDVIFLGDGLELVVSVSGVDLVVKVGGQRLRDFERGDRVLVGIDPNDIVVLDG